MAAIAVLPLARATFDVPYAEKRYAVLRDGLVRSGHTIVGGERLLFDAAEADRALQEIAGAQIDLVLLVQVTFTDAATTVKIAERRLAPLAIWAIPEPRSGGRLRLNAFCGLNLAAHALGRAGLPFAYVYAAPEAIDVAAALGDMLHKRSAKPPRAMDQTKPARSETERARAVLDRISDSRIGLVGEHPAGFDTCRFEPSALKALAGVHVESIRLPDLFARAKSVPASDIAARRKAVANRLEGIDAVNQDELGRSLSIYEALKGLAADRSCRAMAVRCWPEMFTEYGCAACGPMAMLNEDRIPAACEADVYGAMTALLLQEVAGDSSWLVDVVDMDQASNTGVFWHCGLAPLSMCDPAYRPQAQIHSNRRMPLLHQFPLKPGRLTIARLSQAENETKMVLAGAEVLRADPSFTGTSGVVRFDASVDAVMARMMDIRLEHHVAIVYGEHRDTMRAIALEIGIPVVELT